MPTGKLPQALRFNPSSWKDFLSAKESAFRKELKEYLSRFFKPRQKVEDRLKAMRANPDLRWVEKMYPSVLYFEKKVFFCTVDKFYLYLDTIIGPNIQLSSPRYLRGNIVFIDEFDATKQNIQRAIVENAVRFSQDILGLFVRIYYGVSNRQFPLFKLKGADENRMQSLEEKFRRARRRGPCHFGKIPAQIPFLPPWKGREQPGFPLS